MNSATKRLRQVEPNASAQPDAPQRSSPGPHFIVAGMRNTYPLPTSIAESTGYIRAIASGLFFEILVLSLKLCPAN